MEKILLSVEKPALDLVLETRATRIHVPPTEKKTVQRSCLKVSHPQLPRGLVR